MIVTTDDGIRLEVRTAGAGPGLVLVHGFGGAKEDFADHVDALARSHLVVTYDHRGHGESDQPESLEAYSLARLEADVLAVADAVGLATFRLLGHSLGGMVARGVTLRHPGRVEALVLMDTAPGPVRGLDVDTVDAVADLALTQGKEALRELLDLSKGLDTPAHERLLAEREGYTEFNDRKWDALSHVMWAAIVRDLARQPDELEALAGVGCPTLVIVGQQDRPFLRPSRAMADTIPNARLVVVPDAGHSPQFENPDAWFAALEQFLAGLGSAPSRAAVTR
jgi:pimeloyl-ACP methyl ester carboxylesterase